LKTELVATVSHDLKQPLSVMRGYLDLLYMTGDGSDRVQNYIKQLDTAFYSMRQLIDDLLDLAHIESGLDLALKDVHVRNLLESCVEVLQQRSAEKNLTVTVDIPSHIQYVQADEARLRQIFNNLVGNAVKYTPNGGHVEINATTRRNYIYVSVIDDGPGISPDDQAKIFERFYRVRNEHTEDIDGTGLGLAIVKSLVEAHNGAIDIKSQPGEGSTFRVMLPVY
ncbi:MAG: sensor histidine kinase, partial [Aggregatilineales bacterium]